MNELSSLLTQFLLSLSLGTALFSWIANPKLTGAGFMKLITGHGIIFLLLLLILSGVFFGAPQLKWMLICSCALISLGVQWKFYPDSRTKLMWLAFAVQVIATILLFCHFSSHDMNRYLFIFSSALLLGITHYSMLLGHYYLVVPKLSEKPLLVCLRIFWILLSLKLIASGYFTFQNSAYLSEGTTLGDGYIFNWLVVSMRWLWGYFALIVLSYFAWKLCRMRSIQSATGVLYIMVFFVFVGELLSAYLYFKHGLAI